MHLHEIQKEIDKWISTTGVRYFNHLTNLGILMEEVGELSRIMVRTYGEQSTKPTEQATPIADEMADILWVLCAMANQCNVNLEEAFIKNQAKKTLRDKERHQQNPKLKI